MKIQPKGPQAARIRQRKFDLIRRFQFPDDLLPGSLSQQQLRCGKPNCHCAEGEGHRVWSLTFMADGQKQVQHIPKHLVEEVRQRVEAGRAVPGGLARGDGSQCSSVCPGAQAAADLRRPGVRPFLRNAARYRGWRSFLRSPGDGRIRPQIAAAVLLRAFSRLFASANSYESPLCTVVGTITPNRYRSSRRVLTCQGVSDTLNPPLSTARYSPNTLPRKSQGANLLTGRSILNCVLAGNPFCSTTLTS